MVKNLPANAELQRVRHDLMTEQQPFPECFMQPRVSLVLAGGGGQPAGSPGCPVFVDRVLLEHSLTTTLPLATFIP